MRAILMPDLFRNHSLDIGRMVRQHEINVIGDLRVDRIDLVHVRYTFQEEQREFTALITATACDYYIDDRTRQRLKGRHRGLAVSGILDVPIAQQDLVGARDRTDAGIRRAKTENFFEQFTDTGVDDILWRRGCQGGPGGPRLEYNVQTKETRIERMLNFLVQADRIWDRQAMQETTRRVSCR